MIKFSDTNVRWIFHCLFDINRVSARLVSKYLSEVQKQYRFELLEINFTNDDSLPWFSTKKKSMQWSPKNESSLPPPTKILRLPVERKSFVYDLLGLCTRDTRLLHDTSGAAQAAILDYDFQQVDHSPNTLDMVLSKYYYLVIWKRIFLGDVSGTNSSYKKLFWLILWTNPKTFF